MNYRKTAIREELDSHINEQSYLLNVNSRRTSNDAGDCCMDAISIDRRLDVLRNETRLQTDSESSRSFVGLYVHRTATLLMISAIIFWTAVILCAIKLDVLPTHRDFDLIDGPSVSIFSTAQAFAIHRDQNEANEAIEFLRSPNVALGIADNYHDNQLSALAMVNESESSVSYLDFMESGQWNESVTQLTNVSIPLLGRSHKHELKDGCELTVMIVRHCEKGSVREHCDVNGFERSVYLASQFGDGKKHRWPLPSYIFALNPSGRQNQNKLNLREIETVLPLSKKSNVRIDDSHSEGDEHELAKEILNHMKTGKMCGRLAIISWKHSLIGHLARKLGCGPGEGCPQDYRGKDFDSVWLIRFLYTTPRHSLRKSLKLEHVPSWFVYGSVQHEGFDPLAVSKQYGDYPSGGTSTSGRWVADSISYPERKSIADHSIWKQTNVGFGDDV